MTSTDMPGDSDVADVPVVSVGSLGAALKEGLRALFPERMWVEGQVSNLRTVRSGHVYFDLIEPSDEPGRPPAAQFSVALWKNVVPRIERTLAEAGGMTLADDLQVRILARLDFWVPGGRLQLMMDGIDPAFTLGRLAAERERLLHTLADEGLLEANGALAVPDPALRIGLVTSCGSAAHADFVTELTRSGIGFTVFERDTRVQGAGAAEDIAEGLRVVASHRPDVIALVRGGGSAADLSVFDAEVMARAVAGLGVPVFTGVGHEIDRSVADEVAHTAFKTPTACAADLVDRARRHLSALDTAAAAIIESALGAVTAAERRCADIRGRLGRAGRASVERRGDRLEDVAHRLRRAAPTAVYRPAERLANCETRLRALDPALVLARGWSITRQVDGSVLRAADAVIGDVLVTTLADGTVTSTVSDKETAP